MEEYKFTKTDNPQYIEALDAFREANRRFALLLIERDLSPQDYKVRALADISDILGTKLVAVRHQIQPQK